MSKTAPDTAPLTHPIGELSSPASFPPKGFYVPAGFDLESYGRRGMQVAYVLDRILRGYPQWKNSGPGFVPINQKDLERFVHPSYHILSVLLARGAIETDDSWQNGRRSKGYRITGGFPEDTTYVENTDKTLARKIEEHRQEVTTPALTPEP